jgi:membrane protein DedA with SNARE-associated domain
MVYTLAYYGGKPLIQKNHRLLGITWEEIQRVEKRVIRGKRDELTLLALRIVPIPGVAVSGFCGAIRYPFSRFIFITFLGAGIRALALGIVGWQAGEFYFKYIDVFNHFEDQILLGVIAIFAALFAYYLYWRNVKRKRAIDPDRNVS